MDSATYRLITAATAAISARGDELHQRLADLKHTLQATDQERHAKRACAIRQFAIQSRASEGDVEFDDDCVVSESSDNGAYVQAWVWVDFEGTLLDMRTRP